MRPNETCRCRRKTLRARARPARCLRCGCPPVNVFRLLERGRVLVRARLRRGSFDSGSGAMCAKGLRALTKLARTGAKDHTRWQDRLGVCGHVARRCRQLVCYAAALFCCDNLLGGFFLIAAILVCVSKGCGGCSNLLLEQS